MAIAKEYDLPKEVQAAIMEHHGTMPLKYFYLKAKKYTDGDLPYDGYCYDGPKPTSKISAILMICDASEAALRSSGDKSKAEKIVDDIVSERLAFEQFSDCDHYHEGDRHNKEHDNHHLHGHTSQESEVSRRKAYGGQMKIYFSNAGIWRFAVKRTLQCALQYLAQPSDNWKCPFRWCRSSR